MKIISKDIIASLGPVKILRMTVQAPEISVKAAAGQFVVVMADEKGERIPLTIVEADPQDGTITLIFQEAGLTTRILGKLKAGDSLFALLGPLGHPSEIKNYGKAVLVAGGVGIAEILPVAKALKQAGNQVTCILGAKNKDLVILEKEIRGSSDQVHVLTDDGSAGEKGFTTMKLEEVLSKEKYGLVYAVGPIVMMKKAAAITKKFGIKTIVSLNALMVDATGMCGCCRVNIGGEIKFSCIDGPDFDGELVDWEELEKRNQAYSQQEKHICNLIHKE